MQPTPAYGAAAQTTDRRGMAVASLVLGIVGLFAWFIPLIGFPVGVVAIILGAMSMKSSGRSMAIAGLVLGILCLAASIVNGILGAMMALDALESA